MERYNVVLVFNEEMDQLLMCKRAKNPYKGLLNLVGGKIEKNEDDLSAAYRELLEETGIDESCISLHKLMEFQYPFSQISLQAFVGKVNQNVDLIPEVNELLWVSTEENLFDMSRFAGEGNIGHMVEQALYYKEQF